MMGPKQEAQAALFYEFSLEDHVPQDHLLRSIDRFVDLNDIRQYLAEFYSHTGRPSIDPELLLRMLLVGYCFGRVRMERKNQALIAAYARTLREKRKAANLSQEELAFRTDLSMSYISFLETCRRQPTLTVMDAICRELGISLAEFASDVERAAVTHNAIKEV